MNNHHHTSHAKSDSPKDDHHTPQGHDQHAGHSPGMFRDKFWFSLILTLPVVFWSEHIQMLLRFQAPEFFGSALIPPILGTIIFFYGGWVFVQGAWRELKALLPEMMTLISLPIAVAFLFSWVVQIKLIAAYYVK